jgi:hypothetical protein
MPLKNMGRRKKRQRNGRYDAAAATTATASFDGEDDDISRRLDVHSHEEGHARTNFTAPARRSIIIPPPSSFGQAGSPEERRGYAVANVTIE